MKRRVLSLFLALTMLCTLLPQVSLLAHAETLSGTCGAEGDGSNLTWTLDTETGLLTIEGSGAMEKYELWGHTAPWHNYQSEIKTVSFPDGLTNIGEYAFNDCTALTSVTIPGNVLSIDRAAFSHCHALTSVTFRNGVTSIGNYAFTGCNALTGVTFPDSLTSINYGAFWGCTALTSIEIPDGVTSIGPWAFCECTALTTVTIGIGAGIGDCAFDECSALMAIEVKPGNPYYYSMNGILFSKDQTVLIRYPAGRLDSDYTIPYGVTRIAELAFFGCSALKSVTIPDSMTSIGNWAFYGCTALTGVAIPASVTSIGNEAVGYAYFDNETESYVKVPGFTIYGYNGTAAQSYAEENGFKFVSLDNAVGNFTDVKPKDWYADAVLWAVENGITAGVDEHHFAPKQNCTREQVVTFLWAAKGSPEPQSDANPFKDVKKNSWFRKSVLWAVEQGVTGGVDETHFGVGKACDRAQVVMFLWAAAGKPEPETAENKFTDVKKKDYFYSAVLWAVENGVTGGTTPTTFSPKNICTRAQVVTFLYAAYAEK